MGLDMYLYLVKRTYKSSLEYGTGMYPDEFKEFEDGIAQRNFRSMSIEQVCQIGYWRKANAIHNWIIQNCADGVDECQTIYISNKQLQKLLDTCKEVLANPSKARELLPTSSGYFFGSTYYDEWYRNDLKYTIDLIEKIFDFINNGSKDKADYGVRYEASW